MLNIPEIYKGFKIHFNAPVGRFLCEIELAAIGKWAFDIIAFDDWMIETHKYGIEKHGSLSDFIESKFGKEARDFITGIL